jgi:hypothetical protein
MSESMEMMSPAPEKLRRQETAVGRARSTSRSVAQAQPWRATQRSEVILRRFGKSLARHSSHYCPSEHMSRAGLRRRCTWPPKRPFEPTKFSMPRPALRSTPEPSNWMTVSTLRRNSLCNREYRSVSAQLFGSKMTARNGRGLCGMDAPQRLRSNPAQAPDAAAIAMVLSAAGVSPQGRGFLFV